MLQIVSLVIQEIKLVIIFEILIILLLIYFCKTSAGKVNIASTQREGSLEIKISFWYKGFVS